MCFMALRRIVLLSLLLLTLAGCYRQADEGFQPVTIPTEGGEQETLAPVITTMPTETFAPSSATTDTGSSIEPGNTQPFIITIEPTETPLPELVQPTETLAQVETAVFITPGSPQGPVVIETSTPAPSEATSTPSGLITPTDFFNNRSGGECEYIVQRGDTLYTIAVGNNISLRELRAANPRIRGDLILAGDTLQIPGCGEGTVAQPQPTATQVQAADGQTVHVVARGESLYTIAQKYRVTVQSIVDANQLSNPNRIDIGQRLVIPTGN
jgi:LysM repeat protein